MKQIIAIGIPRFPVAGPAPIIPPAAPPLSTTYTTVFGLPPITHAAISHRELVFCQQRPAETKRRTNLEDLEVARKHLGEGCKLLLEEHIAVAWVEPGSRTLLWGVHL